jgi:hypothetical protein
MPRNTVLEHGGRSFGSDTANADVFIKHYASVSRHKFSRAERKVDHDVRVRLTEDRLNPEPLGPESDDFSMEELVSSLKAGKAKGAEGPDGLAPPIPEELGGGRWPGVLCWTPSTSLGGKGFAHNHGEMR